MSTISCPLSPEASAALNVLRRTTEQEHLAKEAAEHLVKCGPCAAKYWVNFIDPHPMAPVQAPTANLIEYEARLLDCVINANQAGECGVIGVGYRPAQRATALAMFARLATKLRQASVSTEAVRIGLPPGDAKVVFALDHALLSWLGSAKLAERLWVAVAPFDSGIFHPNRNLPMVADLGAMPSTGGFVNLWNHEYMDKLRKTFKDSRADQLLHGLLKWAAVPGIVEEADFSRNQIPLEFLKSGDEDLDALDILVHEGLLSQIGEDVCKFCDPALALEVFREQGLTEQLKNLESWTSSLTFTEEKHREFLYVVARRLVDLGLRPVAREWLKKSIPESDKETYDAARALIERWRLTPTEAAAWAGLLDELRIPLALRLAMEALDRDQENAAVRHTLAMLFGRRALSARDAGRKQTVFQSDLDNAEKLLAQLKSNPVAEHSRIQLSMDIGDASGANDLFGPRQGRPQTQHWTSLYIAIQNGLGNRKGALKEAASWMETEPENAWAWMALASCHSGSDSAQDLKEALEVIDGALRADPGLAPALTLRARILRDRGHWNQARDILIEILNVFEDNEHALHLLADMHAESGNWQEANKYYGRLEQADPGNFAALISRCDWLLKNPPNGTSALDEVDQRISSLAKPLKDSPFALSIGARVQLARRDPYYLGSFRSLFSKYMDHGPLRNQLALAYAFVKGSVEPKLFINPGHRKTVRGLNTLAKAYRIARRKGNLAAEAYQLYKESLDLDPQNLYTQRAFHSWWIEMGEPADLKAGMDNIKRAVRDAGLPPEEPPVLFRGEGPNAI